MQKLTQIEFIDSSCDLSDYALVILADEVPMDAALAEKLRTYVSEDDNLLISGSSGLYNGLGDFYLAEEMASITADPPPLSLTTWFSDPSFATALKP